MSEFFLAAALVEMFQKARERWPQMSKEIFDAALDKVLAEQDKALSVKEMEEMLDEKFKAEFNN